VEPVFFASPAEWRAWLEAHHETASEIWVGIWKVRTGRPSVQRFTPRRSTRWSAINVALVAELEAEGLMREAGRRAFAARDLSEEPYSVSNRPDQLPSELDLKLRENPAAAAFWDSSPPSYRRQASFHVTDAKRPETRQKRLALLIEESARGLRLPHMRRR
jgi:uncharacterized protein YdeI (YjbR/CyaY-like superfamily)